ncbi:MAG TPA: dihydrofolate reductase family protein, partial [Nocardioides sp.]
MPKVTYFTATSLDGYIADENSSLDWLFETPHGDDETSWERLMAESAALVMGGTTYRWMIDHDPEMLTGPEKWREYYDERPVWV